jgi:hypothetical protein
VAAVNRTGVAAVFAVVAALAFVAGRWSVSVRRESVLVDRELDRAEYVHRLDYSTTTTAASWGRTQTRTVTRWLPTPAGPRVTQETTTTAETGARERTETSGAETTQATRVREVVRIETVTVEAAPPRLTAGALLGYHAGEPVAGVAVAYRGLGPLSIGAWGVAGRSGAWTAGTSITLTW